MNDNIAISSSAAVASSPPVQAQASAPAHCRSLVDFLKQRTRPRRVGAKITRGEAREAERRSMREPLPTAVTRITTSSRKPISGVRAVYSMVASRRLTVGCVLFR